MSIDIKNALLKIDVLLGQFFKLEHLALIDTNIKGSGNFDENDWQKYRSMYYESDENDKATKYIQRMLTYEKRKLISSWRLSGYLKKRDYKSILELGSGEMFTGLAIKSSLPELRYVSTEYDSYIINICQAIPFLKSIEKEKIDIKHIKEDYLLNFDCILAWDVFYAFNDEDFIKFIQKLIKSDLIVCTSQLIGPVRALSYFLKSVIYKYPSKILKGNLRAHGHKHSLGRYKKLAEKANLNCKLINTPSWFFGDSYYFVLFSKK